MKRLICEMCGSTDLIKENGVFVCQACGCKYSVEEAKKMMIEGTVDVSGSTVKVDNKQKLANLRLLADRAKDENDSQTATKYFEQILIEDPNDWEANFYTIYYAAHNTTVARMGESANRISNCLGSVLQVIKDTIEDNKEQEKAYTEIHRRLLDFTTLIFNNATQHRGNDLNTVRRQINDWIVPSFSMLIVFGDNISDIFADYDTAERVYSQVKIFSSTLSGFNPESLSKVDSVIQQRLNTNASNKAKKQREEIAARERAKQEETRKRIEQYWAQHMEEKKKLEDEKNELTKKIDCINAEINKQIEKIKEEQPTAEYEKKIKEEDNNISLLSDYLRTLGLFKVKEKKAIQEKIKAAQKRRDDINKIREDILKQIQRRIDDVERQAQGRLQPLKNRVDAISTELTKPR